MSAHDASKLVRRAALLVICGADIGGLDLEESLVDSRSTLVEEYGPALAAVWPQVSERVRGVRVWTDELNAAVQAVSPRWKLERMAPVDRSILRLGAWEILYGKLDPIAVISSCVDLGKEYGEKGTPGFVNGLLDQLCRDHSIEMR